MKGEILALIAGIIAGAIKTFLLIIYSLKIKCPRCKKKKKIKEIVKLENDGELIGQCCRDCEKKEQEKKTYFDFGDESIVENKEIKIKKKKKWKGVITVNKFTN